MADQSRNQLTWQKKVFRGWNAYEIGNGLIRIVAVPDIGGRIMAYDLGPYPYIYVDRDYAGKLFTAEENQGDGSLAAWKNYGGDKTWPSPQGWENENQWAGPPDCILDTGRYHLDTCTTETDSATIKMTSPTGSPTGVQIIRQVTIHSGSSRVMLDLSFHNISKRKIRWSIWDVIQLQAERLTTAGQLAAETECVVTAPLNPHSKFDAGYYVMFGDSQNPQWRADKQSGLFIGNYMWEIGKVGLDSRAGWAAFANKATQQAFAARYKAEPDQEYPDNGAGVEFWTVGRGQVANLDYEKSQIYLMELEILSPFRNIAPGETTSFSIEWGACRCPGPIIDVTEGGCVGRKLLAERHGDYISLSGAFGVFDQGLLKLKWLDQTGVELGEEDLGNASPLGVVLLDNVYPVSKDVSNIQLIVSIDKKQYLLAETEVA